MAELTLDQARVIARARNRRDPIRPVLIVEAIRTGRIELIAEDAFLFWPMDFRRKYRRHSIFSGENHANQ